MAAEDAFVRTDHSDARPAEHAEAVTPHDTTTLTNLCRALYIGTTGNVAVLTAGGETVTFTAVPAGTILPIRCQRVNSTNTTASNIVAIW